MTVDEMLEQATAALNQARVESTRGTTAPMVEALTRLGRAWTDLARVKMERAE